MYRFLFTPRWLGNTVFAVAAIAVCLWLGTWQLGRFEDRVVSHHTASAPTAAPGAASPLDSVLTAAAPQVSTSTVGREVTASGRYDAAHQLLVPDRTVDGKQGYYVLTPLRTAAGQAVAVVRGWLPGAPGTPPAPPPARSP